jgi:DNA replication and repair protein RecF
LDIAISQIDPVYLSSLQKYKNLINQRNAFLKEYKPDKEGFDTMAEVFAEQLSECAETISSRRLTYTEKLDTELKRYFEDMMGGKEKPEALYGGAKSKEDFYKLFTANIQKEIRYGVSLYGPHKDDIEIKLNGYDAKEFCSQGQQRSLVLALKIAEGEISKGVCGEYPVFLFDDIMSELDEKRRYYLLNNLKGRQIIMSSCEDQLSDVPKYLVKNGSYTKIV